MFNGWDESQGRLHVGEKMYYQYDKNNTTILLILDFFSLIWVFVLKYLRCEGLK